MDLTEFLPLFSGVRKLFQPDTLSNPVSDQQGVLNPSIGQSADPGAQPQGGLDDNVAQITKLLLDRLNQPDPNVQRMTDLFNQFPAHQNPSIWRRLAAGGAAIGGGQDAAQAVLNAPDRHKQGDWLAKAKQAKDITDADTKNQREEFSNAIKGIGAAVGNQKEKDAAANEQAKRDRDLAKLQNDLELANNKLELAKVIADNNKNNQQNQTDFHNAQLKALETQRQIDNLLHQQQMGELVRNHNLENAAKDAAGFETLNIPDPADPSKSIAVRINKRTGETKRIQLDNEDVGPVQRPISGTGGAGGAGGTGLTNQTKQMMEFSQMLYPHIDEVRKQAYNLEKRGLFGPVMSRAAQLASKIGTTGDPGKVQQNFEDFTKSLQNDRQMPNDAAVGQFLTTLGLLSSGAGRAHGGMRGGGSIQLINYMKALLSSNASLSMFNGNLNGLDSYIKQYAAGPPKPKVPTGLDKAIEDVLKGIK